MGTANLHSIGRSVALYGKRETTYGTYVQPTAASPGCIDRNNHQFRKVPVRENRANANSRNRAPTARFSKETQVEWSVEKEIIPSGSPGVPPDDDLLLYLALGAKMITYTLTVVDYTLIDAATDTITATVDGSATVGTEGSEWTAATSDTATATSIASWLDGLSGISASSASEVVTVTTDTDTQTFTLATSMDSGEATVAGVSVVYQPTNTQGQAGSATLTALSGPIMQAVTGAACEELRISGSGSDLPMYTYSGFGRELIFTGESTLNGAVSASTTTVVQDVDAPNFEANSVVQFIDDTNGTQTNSGGGYLVASRSGSSVVVGTSLSADSGARVRPYAPTHATNGVPVDGVSGSLTVNPGDGTGAQTLATIESYEISIKNNHRPIGGQNPVAFSRVTQDYVEGWLEVTGSITISLDATKAQILGRYLADETSTWDIALTLGSGSGTTVVIDLDTVELENVAAEIPESEVSTLIVPFRALASSVAAQDIIKITYQ